YVEASLGMREEVGAILGALTPVAMPIGADLDIQAVPAELRLRRQARGENDSAVAHRIGRRGEEVGIVEGRRYERRIEEQAAQPHPGWVEARPLPLADRQAGGGVI